LETLGKTLIVLALLLGFVRLFVLRAPDDRAQSPLASVGV
jgi:hypothetical protein